MTRPCQGKRGAPTVILNCRFPDVSTFICATDALSQALIEGQGFKSKPVLPLAEAQDMLQQH